MSSDLLLKAPQLILSFGGEEKFQSLLNRKNRDHLCFKIMSHPGPIYSVGPHNMTFSLNSDVFGEGKVYEEPYQVFDLSGNLIYSAGVNKDAFGMSILDKALILDSKTLDMYCLVYRTPKGYKKILLVINKIKSFTDEISYSDDLVNPVFKSIDLNNQILFISDDVYIDTSSSLLKPYPINIALLNSSTPSTPSNIINSPNTDITVFDSYLFSSFLFSPSHSGWLVLYQDTSEGRKFLNLNIKSGKGVDRLILYSTGVYYVSLSEDSSALNMSSVLSNSSRQLASIDNVIDLRVEVFK